MGEPIIGASPTIQVWYAYRFTPSGLSGLASVDTWEQTDTVSDNVLDVPSLATDTNRDGLIGFVFPSPDGRYVVYPSEPFTSNDTSYGVHYKLVDRRRTMRMLITIIVGLALSVIPTLAQNIPLEEGTWDTVWSPDGTLLAVANPGGLVYLYDADGQLIRTLPGHPPRAIAVTWSPDGQILATSGWDTFIRLWDINTGNLIREVEIVWGPVFHIRWQHNGSYIIASGLDTIQVWNMDKFEPVTIGAGASLLDFEWSPDDSRFAAATINATGTARINGDQFDVTLFTIDSDSMRSTSVAWSSDGARVVTTGNGVRIWDAETGKQIKLLFENDETFQDAVFIGEGDEQVVAISEEGGIYTFDVITGEILETVQTDAFLWSLAWNPDHNLLAIGGMNTKLDATAAGDVSATSFLSLRPVTTLEIAD